jgi:hypothetical protein
VKKALAYLVVALTLLSLCVVVVKGQSTPPNYSSDVKILSYNWYMDSAGFIDAVGEVQNTGQSVLTQVVIGGEVLDNTGNILTQYACGLGTDIAQVMYLAPGQKAPFYLEFYPPQDATNGWYSESLGNVEVQVTYATSSTSYYYPDIQVVSSSSSIGKISTGPTPDFGAYWVTGTLKNTGTQTAYNVTLYGTFYNSTGNVMAVSSTNDTTILSMAPGATTSFKIGAFDVNQTGLPAGEKISTYSLLADPDSPLETGAPVYTPSPTTSTNPTQTSTPQPGSSAQPGSTAQSGTTSTPAPTSSSPSQSTNKSPGISTSTIIAIAVVGAVVVIVGLGAFLALRSRTSQANLTTKDKIKQKRR